MLRLGSSRPWQDAMEILTGQREVLATPLLNYFEPLRVWLHKKNQENKEFIGWQIPSAHADVSNDIQPEVEKQEKENTSDEEMAKLLGPLLYKAITLLQGADIL